MSAYAASSPRAGPSPAAFYVAPGGNNAWSGRLAAPNRNRTNGPFANVARARDAIRQLKREQGGLKQPVTVHLRRGTYYLEEPLVLKDGFFEVPKRPGLGIPWDSAKLRAYLVG